METAEIKRRFLRFFEERGHTIVPSAPLLVDDPTLLFVNAGMVPFKPYLLGQQTAPYPRAASVQKCVRTGDIEEVGKTTRHGTFFQMNGNFSFGDYFKERAIELAWELMTRAESDGGFGLDEADLYVSVYHEDDEAVALWKKIAGLPDDRIARLGMKDNLWSMGVPGPCGPCSEILLDRGPEFGADRDWEAGDRYMELWNLVFMQYERGAGGVKEDYPILGELPAKNIDTGMGMERMAYVLQGVDNIYENDEVFPVLDRAADLAERKYGARHEDDVRLRVVADHVRAAMMLVSDGVVPGNEEGGYVLRRLVRRAVRSMRLLGVDDPVLPELLPASRDRMAQSYPELVTDWSRISEVIYAEEEQFRQTLRTGTQIFDTAVRQTKEHGGRQLPGEKAFQLHDTFGFPIDLTLEMASEQGLSVDEDGFRRLMEEQRERAKRDAQAKKTGHVDLSAYRSLADALPEPVRFLGYDEVAADARVVGMLVNGAPADVAHPGDAVEIVLDRTPFYAEAGGQLADHGTIELDNGARIEVSDVQRPLPGLAVHRARVLHGEVSAGLAANAMIDVARRRAISRAHTATHMVHKAVRELFGETATQAGSENAPGRFRFDYHATAPMSTDVLEDTERKLNDLLLTDLPVTAQVMHLSDARAMGAMALFGEKYGDEVRVVSIGDWAHELCGGTHAGRLGRVGVVKLLAESSIGSGKRRIEALVGADAYDFFAREHALVNQVSELVDVTRADELPDRVAGLVDRVRTAEKELERLRLERLFAQAGQLAESAIDIDGIALVAHLAPEGVAAGDVRRLALDIRGRMPTNRPAVVAVVGNSDGKASVVVALNDEARSRGLAAGDLVNTAAAALGGKGGGKGDVAQGGGPDVSAADTALRRVQDAVRAGR